MPTAETTETASRRDRRFAGTALAVVLPVLIATGACGPESVRNPDAQIGDPDCTATEILWNLGLVPPDGHDRPAPAAGSVPAGFEPVAVVHCRGSFEGPVTPVEPGRGETLDPGLRPLDPADEVDLLSEPVPEPAAPGAGPVTVVEARLEGDLGPLLASLDRPSEVAGPDQVCPAMWQSQPQVYLVDADGRAVRVRWPSDVCGFVLDGVTRPLDALEVTGTQTRTVGVR